MADNYCPDHSLRTATSDSNCQNIKSIEKELIEHVWPAVNNRPKITTLLAIMVIMVGILGGSFGLLYSQAQSIATRVELQGEKIISKVDKLADIHREDIRRIENQQSLIQGSMMKKEDQWPKFKEENK